MPSDNSVLFSLKELRSIEEKRLDREEEEKRLAELECRRRIEEEERIARELAERRRAEIEEQKRRDLQQREREAREERLRLAEAERRARVEAELALERERIAMQMRHAPPRRSGALRQGAFLSIAVVAGVTIAYLGTTLRSEMARSQLLGVKLDGLTERSRAAAAEAQLQIDSLSDQVGRLKTRLAERHNVRAATPTRPDPVHRPRHPAKPRGRGEKPKVGQECKDSTDPICGLTGKRD